MLACCLLVGPLPAQQWVDVQPQFSDSIPHNMFDGVFLTPSDGWFAEPYGGGVWRTTDGGRTWTSLTDSLGVYISDLAFVDSTHGWLTGWENIDNNTTFLWYSHDQGRTWAPCSDTLPSGAIGTVAFIDTLMGFIGGTDSIYRTLDRGHTWLPTESPVGGLNFAFVGDSLGWAGGYSDDDDWHPGVILHTRDSGATWTTQLDYIDDVPSSVDFYTPSFGVAVGPEVLLVTQDGGQHWTDRRPETAVSKILHDCVLTGDSTGWVVGEKGQRAYILQTTDGGQTWNEIPAPTDQPLWEIVFVDNNRVGYIFGENGTLLRYDATTALDPAPSSPLPTSPQLAPPYPNPFNPVTTIRYGVPENQSVRIDIFDLTGHRITTLVNKTQSPGFYTIMWDGTDAKGHTMASGVYFCQLRTSQKSIVQRMLLVR